MKNSKLLISLLPVAIQAPAATIVYTDSHHPPLNADSDQVVYLDAPDTLQHQIFGELPADPVQAEQVAKTIFQSPGWQQKQQQIGQAYQGVLQAYSLRLAKYPAVVFDDRYVVYGTADVALAKARLTDKIITALENGTTPWRKAWQTGKEGLPANAITGRNYSGINVMLLWIDAADKGYHSNRWLTFKQALDAGGNVCKGEKSTLVTLFKPFQKEAKNDSGQPVFDENGETVMQDRCFMTSFHLFNVEQCENLPDNLYPEIPVLPDVERIARAEQIVACAGVPVKHRYQDRAYYRPGADYIMMPEVAQFHSVEDYYSTLLHELVHSTGHVSRLAREGIVSTSQKFGDPVYGFEELIAEMGAAFLCAELGINGDLQHDSYIASWLKTLKEDNRAVFRAARYAREAFEYLVMREQALAA